MPLRNYTSNMPMNRVFESIQKMLVSHGAKEISFTYDNNGLAVGIKFVLQTPRGMLPIKLPVRLENIKRVFDKDRVYYKDEMQPYRTGWKNIHDWIVSQMAMLDTEMVKIEEVFLPYLMHKSGQSVFEWMEGRNYMLPSGEDKKAEEGKVLE